MRVARAGELGGGGTIAAPTRIDGVLAADRLAGAPSFTRSLELSPSSTTRVALGGNRRSASTARLLSPGWAGGCN
ncbi:hypothetical protein P4114_19115 [Pseudomonas aeruginosa]|nr:hypothetical protein [Pseudomonas aeruginosa]